MKRVINQQIRRRTARLLSTKVERQSVTVAVPATSANMGPGFDSLGMALDIWNTLTVEKSDKFEMVVTGEGKEDLPLNESNLVCKSLGKVFELAGKEVPPLRYICDQKIPHSRGMGSSSAAIVSGTLAGIILSGHELAGRGKEEFLQITSEIEGHPDNVAPAIYGGMQLGINTGTERGWLSSRISIPHGLHCVLFVPDFQATTVKARKVLPDMYTKEQMVFNIGRLATLVSAFQNRRFDKIKWGLEDLMHQPYRAEASFPHLMPCIEAAQTSGALGAYLSGAGPTVCALTDGLMGDAMSQRESERKENAIAASMIEAAESVGVTGKVFLTQPSSLGAQVLKAYPAISTERLARFSTCGEK